MSKIKLINGPLDGYEFDVGILEDVHAIDVEFKDHTYRYEFVDGKFIFSDREYRSSKYSKRFKNERLGGYEYEMFDCPNCGKPAFRDDIAKLKCGMCIYKLIKSGDIIES